MTVSEAKAKSTSWAITYADLTTLLLTFFVLLLVIMNDAEKHIDRVINRLLDETYEELKQIESKYVSVERVTKGVKITMASGELFRSNEAEVQPIVHPLLRQIGSIIRVSKLMHVEEDSTYANLIEVIKRRGGVFNVEIRCEGHTDDLPVKQPARYESNWDLSTARALNIVKLLSEFSHIPEPRFSAMGYGEFRPVIDPASVGKNSLNLKEARAKNRRVEIYLDAFIKTHTVTGTI